ncbi:MAG TPA: tetratricopeptide repeat protein [Rhodanobacteraceae bacterium]|jgi:serine/threonine-protein kinase|nr:tetratricopeptide repeat protein [Rhodanobacteraceae bacterium]
MTQRRSVFAELKRRNVLRAGAFYLAAAWLLAQVVTQILPVFDAPSWLLRSVIVALAVGFPFWLALAWFYEWTPQGLRRESEIDPSQSIARTTGKKLDRWIIAVLVVAVVLLLTDRFVLRKAEDSGAPANSDKSIAVLPFEHRGAEAEYLGDGLTESLINALSQLPKLRVSPRSTVFRYKSLPDEPREIGRKLGVDSVLSGRVQQQGDAITIQAELVDVARNAQLWGEQYQRRTSDVLAVQSEISRAITAQLRLKLSGDDEQRLYLGQPRSSEAYLLFLKGRFHAAQYTRAGVNEGLELFRQAIEVDPDYALAYDGIAYCYLVAGDWYLPSKDALTQAKEAALHALALGPDLPAPHVSMAQVHWWLDWDWPGAEREFVRALQLDPTQARPRGIYAWFLITTGRADQGLEQGRKSQAVEPLNVEINELVGQSLFFARRFEQAVAQLRTTLDMDPNSWLVHAFLGRALQELGRNDDAIAELRRAVELEDDVPEARAALAAAYARAGKRNEAERELAILQTRAAQGFVPSFVFTMVYAAMGEEDRALGFLERAIAAREFYATGIGVDPSVDSLRESPRFKELMRRVGVGKEPGR